MSRARFLWVSLLSLAVTLSAVGVVYAKYASRKAFVELQQLREQRDQADVEWGRLQLEQSTWGTHGRVERIAREKLQMHIPETSEIVMISAEP
jgi:cell division protein FtsL